ncbi:SinR family protein [Pseudomonas sp. Q2-TVG4-2]|uniref:SinR family protein n=1 Tax=Pseudomonas sp. Q2-TVG4-2 TaxID=1685699 RepID=UPI0015E657BE|nr:SinR family protein [Pseudomonas sp. Q2-TVG4-2]
MASILIGYDLNKQKNYAALIEAIEELSDTRWHCLDSTWIIVTETPCKVIRDRLRGHIDEDDELLVVKLSGSGAWAGFKGECKSWLKENL